MTAFLELGDYCEIAAALLGTTPEQIAALPNIGLADSALAAPRASFADQEAYPTLIEKAAVCLTFGRSDRNCHVSSRSHRSSRPLEAAESGQPFKPKVAPIQLLKACSGR